MSLPPAASSDPRRGDRTVGIDHRPWGLDLHLEPQRAVGQAEPDLEPLEHLGEDRDVLGRGDLRERDDEPLGQPARGLDQGRQERVEGSDAPSLHAVGERLHAEAEGHRCGSGPAGRVEGSSGLLRVAVLLVVGPDAVPVLEVHAEVLDRLPLQLGVDARPHAFGDRGVHAERVLERGRVGSVRLEQPEGLGPELDRRRGRDAIGRHVQGVQRLTNAIVAREAPPMPGFRLASSLEQVEPAVVGDRPAHAGERSSVRRTVPSIRPDGLSVTTKTCPSFLIPQ